jgi:hypothetical protein
MTITKVSYGKTYPLGNYSSERIDLEASVEEGERITGVIELLKEICDREHKANNPHLYQEQGTQYPMPFMNEKEIFGQLDNLTLTKLTENQPLTQEQKIHNLITQSTSLPELKQWELLSNNKIYPSLKQAYENKLKELTK